MICRWCVRSFRSCVCVVVMMTSSRPTPQPVVVTPKAPPTVRLRIQNLLGAHMEVDWPLQSTVREMKEAVAVRQGLDPTRQTLIRCGQGTAAYLKLEDHRTLEDYGLANNDRLLLVPALRSGPMTDTGMARIFPETGDGSVEGAIDRMLKERGTARKPEHIYMLAQLDVSRPGDWTIIEQPLNLKSIPDQGPSGSKEPGKRVEATAEERKQNKITKDKMAKLLENIKRRKELRQKKQSTSAAPTPVANIEATCDNCGELTDSIECPKCLNTYCNECEGEHSCKRRNICHQQ